MLRKHRVLIAGLALACVGSANAATLVISEFRFRGPSGGNDEFIELYNAGTAAVGIGGYKINGSSNSGATGTRATITAGTTLNPGCHYLLTNNGSSGYSGSVTGNQTYNTGVGDDGGIALLDASNTIIDQVGLSAGSAYKEGTTLASLGSTNADRGYERKPGGAAGNGTDTDNNASDFAQVTPSNPQNLASACVSQTPSISIADATVAEGNSGTATLTFNVTLSGPAPAGGVGFSFATSNGTATTTDNDYAANSGTGSIAAGATSTTVTVTVNGDAKHETDETLTVTLSGLSNATAGDVLATGTITNDDAQPSLSIADALQAEGNSGTSTMTFTVTQSAVSGLPTTFDLATFDDTATTAGGDYVAASQTGVTIAPGATSATFDVTINGDTVPEPGETFFVNLTNAANASVADGQAVGTIANDDVAVSPGLSISNATVTEGDSGTVTATFTITSTMPVPPPGVTVDVATQDDTATAADADYVPVALTATIMPLMTFTTVTVTINGDTKIEADESFFVNLSNAVGATLDDPVGTGLITNDDVAPDLSVGDASVTEGNGGTTTLTFPVTLSAPAPQGGVSFSATTADGTATVANNDYVALKGRSGTIPAGETTGSVMVTVNGDTAYEPNETFTVALSDVTQANVTDGTATGTITNDDFLEIHALQGSGLASPINNSTVVTRGNIVTGKGPQGFTMQAPDARADNDVNTSEGIYVFTSTAPTVAVGDMVDVTGTVTEFNGLTEITGATITTTSVSNPLPTPVDLNATVPSQDPENPTCTTSGSNYECFEFMRVRIADGLVNTGNQRFGSPATETFAEVFVTANGRRGVREPGILFPLQPTAGNMTAGRWDGNPDMFELDADYFGAVPVDTPIYGGTKFTATGVLGYDFGDYELWATEFSVVQAPAYPRPVRDSAGSTDLRIGAYNMLRFCDTTNSAGSGQDPCLNPTPTQAQLDAKVARLSAYVKDVLKLPDVLGVEEVENITVLNALAAKLTTDGGVPYTARLEEGNDIGGIDVGFLIRTDRVTNITVTQLGKTQTWNDPTGSPTALLHDRPPLLLEAVFTPGGNLPFAVMVVHPKARSCTDAPTGSTCTQADVDRNRLKRFEQGKYHAQQIQAFQNAHPNVPLTIVGDFNAYQFTDGWTDVVGAMAGTYDDAANLLDLGANIVSPALWNAVTSLPLNDQYSFLYTENFGQIQGFNTRDVPTQQVLDHALLNTVAKRLFTGFDYGRAGEDAPAEVERQCGLVPTPAPPACPHPAIGVSDHDGFVFVLATDRIFTNGFEAAQ